MDKESAKYNSIHKRYVIDDGWNLPVEVTESIYLKIQESWIDAYLRVCKKNKRHIGKWLTKEIAKQYEAKSLIYRLLEDNQYKGKVRELSRELQREYGVTELEAINILNGKNVDDYINKYNRIRYKIPDYINEQAICDDVVNSYLKTVG